MKNYPLLRILPIISLVKQITDAREPSLWAMAGRDLQRRRCRALGWQHCRLAIVLFSHTIGRPHCYKPTATLVWRAPLDEELDGRAENMPYETLEIACARISVSVRSSARDRRREKKHSTTHPRFLGARAEAVVWRDNDPTPSAEREGVFCKYFAIQTAQ
jgi:hypothetical protein